MSYRREMGCSQDVLDSNEEIYNDTNIPRGIKIIKKPIETLQSLSIAGLLKIEFSRGGSTGVTGGFQKCDLGEAFVKIAIEH